jgi:hypothetical protein
MTVMSLWLPILVSAVFVFIASSIIHMLLPYHRSDYVGLPDEAGARAALRDVPPGQYMLPHGGRDAMKDPAFKQRMEEGPVAILRVRPAGMWNMGTTMGGWFIYCLVVSLFAGYVVSRALPPVADYLAVFRFAGTTAFAAYVLGLWQDVIWAARPVNATLKSTFDGLIYALITAGTFGWLWPTA